MKKNKVLELTNVSLDLRQNSHGRSIKSWFVSLFSMKSEGPGSSTILKDISLSIYSGDSLSIVGLNGSGKTTLLRVISGIYQPSKGHIFGEPTCAPLIELNGAFNPELSIVENIQQLHILLGRDLSNLEQDIEQILDWSELNEWRNKQVRLLSTGMLARLAFAIATSEDSNMLVIDESLSVGDMSFSRKALSRIDSLTKRGAALILVTHDLDLAKNQTKKCIWMKDGEIFMQGSTSKVLRKYIKSFSA